MEKITIAQAQRLTAPCPFALLSVLMENGRTNLMAVSWWTYLSNHPATIGVCLSKKGLSGALIQASGEFGLSIVGESLRDSAIRCGTCSGRTTDKAVAFGIPLAEAETLKAKIVDESRVVFECKLRDTKDVGDHVLYIAEIAACRGDASINALFAFDGYGRLDTAEKSRI